MEEVAMRINLLKYYSMLITIVLLSWILAGCNDSTSITPEPGQKVKVLSYNVWIGFQEQDSLILSKYTDWVNRLDPDIIAYQELNHYTQEDLEELADEYSHPFAIQSKEEGYPVALSSKFPIVNFQRVLDNMHHGYIYGVTNNIHVFVIHFTPFGKRGLKKRQEEVETILAHAGLLPDDEMVMILGDFNAPSPSDSSYYLEHGPDYEDEDYSVIVAMEEAGFRDVYNMFHDDFKKSIPTPTRVEQVGTRDANRIDFAFVNSALAEYVVHADIIHDEYTDIISDHYPVYFELEF